MKLTELLYPFAFLPVCLLLYYVLPKRCRNAALLAASLLFFAWGTPEYLVLLVLAILLNYFAGLELESLLEDGKTGHARLVLVLTILADLLPLLFFKYYGEAAAALNRVFVLSLPVHALPAPVGVSFYTFTLLSALSDVYHGRAPMEKNLIRFALFVSFFPKLTSGPIVQYADMQPQLEPHEFVRERVGSGMRLFVIGLAKKVILAGLLGTPFYALKALGPQALSVCGAWLGALLYALMLYFDFSGYSDMAIGAAKMFGFEVVEKGEVAEKFKQRDVSEAFWAAFYSLQETLFKRDVATGESRIETDSDKIKESLADFAEIVKDILESDSEITKSDILNGNNIETLKNIYKNTCGLLIKAGEMEESMTKAEVEALIKEAVNKANSGNNSDGVDDETKKFIIETVKKLISEQKKEEPVTKEEVTEMLAKAVEPIYKARGIATNLNNEPAPVEKEDDVFSGMFV